MNVINIVNAITGCRLQRSLFAALLAVVLHTAVPVAGANEHQSTINLYTYHTHPPFLEPQENGLTYELARRLEDNSQGRYGFKVVPVSRAKLDYLLASGEDVLIPWVNPAWFASQDIGDGFWVEQPLVEDGNVFVSLAKNPLHYSAPSSLNGRILGGIRGHNYAEIDDYREQFDSYRRLDADGHTVNLRLLANGRIDVAIMPASAAHHFVESLNVIDAAQIVSSEHSRYSRHLLLRTDDSALRAYVTGFVSQISKDGRWLTSFFDTKVRTFAE